MLFGMVWKRAGLLLAPFFSFLARLSERPPPGTTSDEGAGRRKELLRRSRESLAAHLGARRGVAVRRSEQGRIINGVSPPSLPWVNPHGLHLLYGFFMVFHSILALKLSIVSFNLVLFGLFFILCFETNVHFYIFEKANSGSSAIGVKGVNRPVDFEQTCLFSNVHSMWRALANRWSDIFIFVAKIAFWLDFWPIKTVQKGSGRFKSVGPLGE